MFILLMWIYPHKSAILELWPELWPQILEIPDIQLSMERLIEGQFRFQPLKRVFMDKMHSLAYMMVDNTLITNKSHQQVNILGFLSRVNFELKDYDPYLAKWEQLPNILSVLIFANTAIFDQSYTLDTVIQQFITSKITVQLQRFVQYDLFNWFLPEQGYILSKDKLN